ncbi:MAG: NAD(+)/NADH kinase [Solirubrobacterales bacterium]|nr:NAD(+)/NADH kinase [Solirubrobacterales bacterium]
MRSVAVLTHSRPSNTDEAIAAAARAAESAGCSLVVVEREPGAEDREGMEGVRFAPELPSDVDLCIALGGDGTILRALRHYTGTSVPVFGINYGTVGFLAAVEADDLATGLARALAGDFETVSLPGLEAKIGDERFIAVNDVSFIRRPHQRVAELSYSVGGREVGRVRCDGLVAATPAGSTGYNLANNGPILAWGVEGYVVSFIAPHTLTARALVVAPDDLLHVTNVGIRDPVDVGIDGVESGVLEPGDEVVVGFRDNLALLAQLEGETFYRRIREKFGRLAH